jgi:hypothetical protein
METNFGEIVKSGQCLMWDGKEKFYWTSISLVKSERLRTERKEKLNKLNENQQG